MIGLWVDISQDIVLAPEGRFTRHFYPSLDGQGLGWDTWYRRFESAEIPSAQGFSENVDAATIDHFVDYLVTPGLADPSRIFVTGWSNGGAMALTYGLSRRFVRAAALYSAPDPFDAFGDPCPQRPAVTPTSNEDFPVSNPDLAILHVHRDCDVEGLCLNAELLRSQLEQQAMTIQDVIFDSGGKRVGGCDRRCGTDFHARETPALVGRLEGLLNHSLWPKGYTETMLDFFSSH